MAKLVSSWYRNVRSVPANYVWPPEKRPGDFVQLSKDIPVIDLAEVDGRKRVDLVRRIINACEEFGLFQVINHGMPDEMMMAAMDLYKEFFDMPVEDKSSFYSDDVRNNYRLYTGGAGFVKEETCSWKDTMRHPCYPLEDHVPSWPEKPARYREEVSRYCIEARKVGSRILDLIGEGLGLKEGYFGREMIQSQSLTINHYPPCPDPTLTMGVDTHVDLNLITLLQQEVCGLQILKDGQWLGVEPIPNAFVIGLGYQMEVISNRKLRGVEHRVVTNQSSARTSVGTFIAPAPSSVMKAAEELVAVDGLPNFKPYTFGEFMENYFWLVTEGKSPLDPYLI